MIQSPATKISTGMLPLYEKINWLHVLVLEIAAVLFFLPAGRFHFSLFGLSISTGYDAYKLFPVIFIVFIMPTNPGRALQCSFRYAAFFS